MPKLSKVSKPVIEEKIVTDLRTGVTTKTKTSPAPEIGSDEKFKIVSISESGLIHYEKGVTKNMGDYNSAKVSVGITMPFNPTAKQIEEAKATITLCCKIVDSEIEAQVDLMKL